MTEPRTEAGRRLLESIDALPAIRPTEYPETAATIISRGAAYDRVHDALPAIEAEAVEAALTVERIAAALAIGWPGSRARQQAYRRALAAALRVALLAPSEEATE
jgi:hypothetical protein